MRLNPQQTNFLFDGGNIVQEQGIDGSSVANLLTGFGLDENLVRVDASGTHAFLTDALGSSVALADTDGTLSAQYQYDPFGAISASGTSSNALQYTGRENDGTGFYYLRNRYYSPALQRFISEDPLGFSGGVNLYEYAADDPVSLSDPSGLKPAGPGDPAENGTRPTFNACMTAHANDFSILGAINAGTNALFNRQDTYKNNVVLGALGGNSITSLLYGSTADAAGTGVTLAPTIVTAAMGTVTSYGRRTSTIMALNIAGKGGLPFALGASSAGAKGALTTAGKWLGLGLDFEVKLGIDAAFAAAEAAYCYSQTQ